MSIILAIFILPIIAQQQVVDSARAEALLESQLEIKSIDRQSYTEQLGFEESELSLATLDGETIESRILLATGEKNYPITVGDVYSLTYVNESGLVTVSLTVPHGKTMRVPNFGTITTENKTFAELKSEIEDLVLRYYPYGDPDLSIVRTGAFLVQVSGEAKKSTTVESWGLSRLSSIVPYASESASTRNVTVYSENGSVKKYDLYEIMREGNGTDPLLKPGDKVVFAKRGPEITISGSVNREGTYQITGNETLENVLATYAHGILPSADTAKIGVVRYTNGKRSEYKINVGSKFPLCDGDMINVFPSRIFLGSVTVEGALTDTTGTTNNTTNNTIKSQSTVTLFYRFVEGESIRSMIETMTEYFSASSDLSGCYLIRDGVSTPINFSEILYGNSLEGEKTLKNSDRFIIPFSQNIVTVNGAVNSSGTYGYVPGKTANYYIARAGGTTSAAKSSDDYTITDRYGNVLDHNAEIPAEAVIEIKRNDFVNKLQPTITVVSLTAGIIGIVAASLAILLPNIY
ncbi:MAG: hypothetical protein K6G51_06405 [Sphaerochaetaceae bacterium]|nr:hypothetical protein [Sphaerochaetaceae bacterium]